MAHKEQDSKNAVNNIRKNNINKYNLNGFNKLTRIVINLEFNS